MSATWDNYPLPQSNLVMGWGRGGPCADINVPYLHTSLKSEMNLGGGGGGVPVLLQSNSLASAPTMIKNYRTQYQNFESPYLQLTIDYI